MTRRADITGLSRRRGGLSRRVVVFSPALRYGMAVGVAIAAILVRLGFDPVWGIKLPYITLFPAIMLSAWIGGAGPGMLTTVLTALAAEYFWIEPTGSWLVDDKTELVGLALFVVIGVFISLLNESWRRSIDAVGASEDRLRVTIQSLGDAVIATDEHGRVTQLNPVAEALTGWEQGEAVGRAVTEVLVIVNEETRRPAENPVERVLREGTVTGLANHTLLISRTGRVIPIDDSASPVRIADGSIVGTVMVFRDVTERRQIERERAERQHASQELAAIVESSDDAILRMDLDGTITAWNHAAERMYGYTASDAIGQSIHLIVPDNRVGEEDEVLERIRRGDRVDQFETVRRRKDGTTFSASLTMSPVRDAVGAVIGASKIARDITSRQRADERFRLAVEAAPAAMIMVDGRGVIQLINALTEQLLGYTRDELVGQSVERLVPPRFAQGHAGLRAAFFSESQQRPMGEGRDLYALRKDGTEVAVEIGLSPVDTADGLFVLAAVTDITERKRTAARLEHAFEAERVAKREAEHANELKDLFLATVSHELRGPLNAILGWAEMLRANVLEGARRQRALDAVYVNARRQSQLIDDLLDVARIVSGRMRMERTAVNLHSVIRGALDVTEPSAQAKHIRVSLNLDESIGMILGDAARLQQVVWNLLTNAVKFTPEGGSIHVDARRAGEFVELAVSDSGRGIAPGFLPSVFEPFRQADASTTREHGGLGLGLAIVKHLVEAHDGTVTAASGGEGQGATFTVRLPIVAVYTAEDAADVAAPVMAARVSSEAPALTALSGITVVVAEDEADSRELVAVTLESYGAIVIPAASAAEALRAIDSHRIDALLSDIAMPGEHGYSLIRTIRAREVSEKSHLPAAALTSFAREDDRQRALDAGFDAHFAKPIDAHSLVTAVAALAHGVRTS